MNIIVKKKFLSFAILLLGIVYSTLFVTNANAQDINENQTVAKDLQGVSWNAFTPPTRGIPGRREGGATRGTNRVNKTC